MSEPEPRSAPSPSHRGPTPVALWLIGVVCGGVLLWLALREAWVTDDALITFRYVDNLLAGRGLVYNAAERLESFSSPLWLMLLSLSRSLGLDLFTASKGLGIACSLAELIMLLALLWRYGRSLWAVAFAGLLFSTDRMVAVWASGGLETALFSALVFASFALSVRRHDRASGNLAAAVHVALAASRPEGLAYYALYFMSLWRSEHAVKKKRAMLLRSLMLTLGPVAFLLLARFAYYGRLLPHTYNAKLAGVSAATFGPAYIGHFIERLGLLSWHLPAWLLLGWLLWSYGRTPQAEPQSKSDEPRAALMGIFRNSAVYVLSGCLLAALKGGDYMNDFRFMRPLMGVLYAGVGASLALSLSNGQLRAKLMAAVAAAGLLASHGLRQLSPSSMFDAPAPAQHKARLSIERAQADDFRAALQRIAEPGDSLLSDWSGYMGWGHIYRTIDCTGLTSPHIGERFYLRPLWSRDRKRERLPGHARWPQIAFMTENELTIIFPRISREGHDVAEVTRKSPARYKRYPYLHATLALGDGRYLRFFTRLSADALAERAERRDLDLCWRPPQGDLYCPGQPPPHPPHAREPLPPQLPPGLVWRGPPKPPRTPAEALSQYFTAMDKGDCGWARSVVAGRQRELMRHSTCAQLEHRFNELAPIRLLRADNERPDGRNPEQTMVDVVYYGRGRERSSILLLQQLEGVWYVVRF